MARYAVFRRGFLDLLDAAERLPHSRLRLTIPQFLLNGESWEMAPHFEADAELLNRVKAFGDFEHGDPLPLIAARFADPPDPSEVSQTDYMRWLLAGGAWSDYARKLAAQENYRDACNAFTMAADRLQRAAGATVETPDGQVRFGDIEPSTPEISANVLSEDLSRASGQKNTWEFTNRLLQAQFESKRSVADIRERVARAVKRTDDVIRRGDNAAAEAAYDELEEALEELRAAGVAAGLQNDGEVLLDPYTETLKEIDRLARSASR